MSRRFGRNRRRKMRNELETLRARNEALIHALSLQSQLVADLRKRKDNAEEQLRRVASIVGYRFFGLDPKYVHANSKFHGNVFVMPIQSTPSMSEFNDFTTVEMKSLEMLCLQVSESSDYFQTCLHVRLGNEYEFRYAVTEQCLDTMPESVLIETISREVGVALADCFHKKQLGKIRQELLDKQEPLGADFERVLYDNLEDLYEE